jgi:hypothetical protein
MKNGVVGPDWKRGETVNVVARNGIEQRSEMTSE